jgi:hypothetical protein
MLVRIKQAGLTTLLGLEWGGFDRLGFTAHQHSLSHLQLRRIYRDTGVCHLVRLRALCRSSVHTLIRMYCLPISQSRAFGDKENATTTKPLERYERD